MVVSFRRENATVTKQEFDENPLQKPPGQRGCELPRHGAPHGLQIGFSPNRESYPRRAARINRKWPKSTVFKASFWHRCKSVDGPIRTSKKLLARLQKIDASMDDSTPLPSVVENTSNQVVFRCSRPRSAAAGKKLADSICRTLALHPCQITLE